MTGDAVTLAARLEESADPGQIVVSERTVRAGRDYLFRPLGERVLKGRSGPEDVYELIGPAALEPRAPAFELVGREGPMAELLDAYAARRGHR